MISQLYETCGFLASSSILHQSQQFNSNTCPSCRSWYSGCNHPFPITVCANISSPCFHVWELSKRTNCQSSCSSNSGRDGLLGYQLFDHSLYICILSINITFNPSLTSLANAHATTSHALHPPQSIIPTNGWFSTILVNASCCSVNHSSRQFL